MKNLAFEIFKENQKKIIDLYGYDIKDGELIRTEKTGVKTYQTYYRLFCSCLAGYKPAILQTDNGEYIGAVDPNTLPADQQEEIREMIECIIDTVYYAKHKGKKNEV